MMTNENTESEKTLVEQIREAEMMRALDVVNRGKTTTWIWIRWLISSKECVRSLKAKSVSANFCIKPGWCPRNIIEGYSQYANHKVLDDLSRYRASITSRMGVRGYARSIPQLI